MGADFFLSPVNSKVGSVYTASAALVGKNSPECTPASNSFLLTCTKRGGEAALGYSRKLPAMRRQTGFRNSFGETPWSSVTLLDLVHKWEQRDGL